MADDSHRNQLEESPKSSKTNDVMDNAVEAIDLSNTSTKDALISTAVHFLQNPKVQNVPIIQKRAFLRKKGLTDEEIDLAMSFVGSAAVKAMPNSQNLLALRSSYPGAVDIYRPPSLWHRWRDVCSSAMVIGATCYGFYYFFKRYIEPLVIGKKRHEEDRMSKIERHLTELNRSLSQLRHSLISVESALTRHQGEASTMLITSGNNSQELTDLRAEVSSIKSLLLGRKQFPAAPPSSLGIPTWQCKQKEEESEAETPVFGQDPENLANGLSINGELTAH